MSEGEGEHLMTIAEIRQLTGVSRTTIYRWINQGKLTPVAVSSEYLEKPQPRFRRKDVEALHRPRKPPA